MNKKDINFDYKRLHPFKWFILENYPFLEDSIDVLTNYQLFCKLGEMYNKQVNSINTLGVQVEALTDWFDDLDVQEEINNKLDEMAESGELEEIISAYINTNAVICFDTVSDMKSSENLVDGSYAKTLGFYSINDGGGATYKIRSIESGDTINESNLIEINNENNVLAELIIDNIKNIKCFGLVGDGETDDTTNFYIALNNLKNVYIPEGEYLIDFNNIDLVDTTIIGEEKKTKIIQKNNNIPFGQVKTNTVIKNIWFVAENNENSNNLLNQSILYFGNNGTEFVNFIEHDLDNLYFKGNEYTIPLYFNMDNGGCVGGNIHNIIIKTCNYGIMFDFKTLVTRTNWLNGQTIDKVWIERPKNYGFYWKGTNGGISNGSYDNIFNNISVELFDNNAIGFHVGDCAGTFANCSVYNDVRDSGNKGYCLELEDTDSYLPKSVTTIRDSKFEGLVKNDYNKMSYKIFNVAFNEYEYFGQTEPNKRYTEFSEPISLYTYDLMNPNDFTDDNNVTLNNAVVTKKVDKLGQYLSITKTDYTASGQVRFRLPNTLKADLGGAEYITITCCCNRGNNSILPQFYKSGTFTQDRILNLYDPNLTICTRHIDMVDYTDSSDTQVYISLPSTLANNYEMKIYGLKVYVGRGGSWPIGK